MGPLSLLGHGDLWRHTTKAIPGGTIIIGLFVINVVSIVELDLWKWSFILFYCWSITLPSSICFLINCPLHLCHEIKHLISYLRSDGIIQILIITNSDAMIDVLVTFLFRSKIPLRKINSQISSAQVEAKLFLNQSLILFFFDIVLNFFVRIITDTEILIIL